MPDWTYQTIFKPILTRLPFEFARRLALWPIGTLADLPGGSWVVRFFGHAQPTPEMGVLIGDVRVPTPCGVSAYLDDSGSLAMNAWPLLGVSVIGADPLLSSDSVNTTTWDRSSSQLEASGARGDGWFVPDEVRPPRNPVAVLVRLPCAPAETTFNEVLRHLAHFGPQLITFTEQGDLALARFDESSFEQVRQMYGPEVSLAFGCAISPERALDADYMAGIIATRWDFVVVRPEQDEQGRVSLNQQQLGNTLAAVKQVRQLASSQTRIIAHGGAHEPADALHLREAGADIVMLDSGLVESGPGLPKRINKLLNRPVLVTTSPPPLSHQSWLWTVVLGIALLIGGGIAMCVGLTRVVLPYDEEFLGMLREELCGLNLKLLDFMQHDRITLAGTMLSLGVLYVVCGACGERRGRHWVRVAALTSATIGFFSFFLFLGYGYFDPFHAFITAVLFQFVLFGFRSQLLPDVDRSTDERNSPAWQRALWGQLIFILHGIAIVVAGCVICGYGATDVFVREDLEFMGTTRNALVEANARLVPLVAHDRAAFGGMLVSTGVFVTLASLWGWRRGDRWVWWSLLVGGSVAYLLTIGVHWYVGYTSLKHLLPAYGGLAAVIVSSLLSRRWLCAR